MQSGPIPQSDLICRIGCSWIGFSPPACHRAELQQRKRRGTRAGKVVGPWGWAASGPLKTRSQNCVFLWGHRSGISESYRISKQELCLAKVCRVQITA